MKPIKFAFAPVAALVALAPFGIARAEPPVPRSPPSDAFDACERVKEGDACSVNAHGRAFEGTCQPFRDLGLACRPHTPPPGPPPD